MTTYAFQSAATVQPGDRLFGGEADQTVQAVEQDGLVTRLHCADGKIVLLLSGDRVFVACEEENNVPLC